jgi:uncharacterized protein PFB0145c
MPNNVTTENITKKDLIDNIKKTKNLTDELNQTKNKLDQTIKFLNNIGAFIDSRIKIYIDTLNNDNFIQKSQDNLVEEKKDETNKIERVEDLNQEKEKKIDVSKFIEVFSKEFTFINKDEFNDEMENDEIMGNIIEKIKKAFTNKENSIMDLKERVSQEIRETNILKETVSKYKNELNEKEKRILEKENEINSYKSQLENKIKENIKLEKDYNDELNLKKNEIVRLENVERILTAGKTKLEKEKKELEEKNKENSEKMKIFMTKYEEKEKELKSVGDLLEAKKLYDKYLSMETRILSKLDNVLIQRDFESFISSGYTLSSLDNVWDIVKIEYKNISKEDKETLKEVFAFFLNQINKRFKDAKYGLVQVEVGEDFDAVNQVDLSQNSKGTVTECVFYGYGFLAEKENPNDEDIIARIIKNPLVLTA